MKYSKHEIGKALTEQLNKGYNIERISNWADKLLISMRNKKSPELDDILRDILIMDAGPEFEYTEQELRLLAEMLLNNEKDPIKQINDITSKKNELKELLHEVADKLPTEDVNNITEYVEYNEWGLAYETLCVQLCEYEIEISSLFYEKIEKYGISIGCSSMYWTPLRELIKDSK